MHAAALGFTVALGAFVVLTGGLQAGEASSVDPRISAPFLPGVGTRDPCGRFDPERVPWRAVGKLQAVALNLRILCTGTLVNPSTVLTAAHCVFNPRTQHNFPPRSLHFLIGYDSGRYAGHATGVKIQTAPSYEPSRPSETRGSDWAMISLDTRLGSADRVLPMVDELPGIGSTHHARWLPAGSSTYSDGGCRVPDRRTFD